MTSATDQSLKPALRLHHYPFRLNDTAGRSVFGSARIVAGDNFYSYYGFYLRKYATETSTLRYSME